MAARAGAVGAGVAERAEVGQPADLRDPLAEARYQDGPGARRHGDNAGRALAPVPGGKDFDHRIGELVRDRPIGSLAGEQHPQRGSPADIGETAERAARLGRTVRGDLAGGARDPQVLHPRRPHPPRLDRDPGAEQSLPGCVRAGLRDLGVRLPASAVVAAAAAGRLRVVELMAQVLHPAGIGHLVGQHGLLFADPLLSDPLVPLFVVGPQLAGGLPAAAGAAHRPVDVEHLEHGLEPAPGQVDAGLQRGDGQRPARLGERGERRPDLVLGRKRERGEVRPDVPVLAAGQQDHRRFGHGPAGPADLLVVSDRGLRGTEVHHEPQVGLVEPHAQRAGRHQRLDPVGQQVIFGLQPVRLVVAAAVRGDVDSLVAEERRRLVGRGDRQRVDDPRSRQAAVGEPGRQPGEPLVGGRQAHHRQAQRLPVQRAAQHEYVALVLARAELLGDVAGDPGRWSPAPGSPAEEPAAACGSAGSRGGSRGPSRRCSVPRRSRSGPPRR